MIISIYKFKAEILAVRNMEKYYAIKNKKWYVNNSLSPNTEIISDSYINHPTDEIMLEN